jgi:hypothetical protein
MGWCMNENIVSSHITTYHISGYYVKLQFRDLNNNPTYGLVTVHRDIQVDELPFWITMFGYAQPLVNSTPYIVFVTDANGYVDVPMYESMKYDVTFDNTTGQQYKFKLYPKESEYVFFVKTAEFI